MLQGADWAYARRGTSVERRTEWPALRRCIIGGALLAVIYGIVVAASIGLFRAPPSDTHGATDRLIGLLNIAVLPLLVLATVGVRRIWLDGTRHRHLSPLLMAPLWLSLMLSLLTVPIWMGQANAAQHGSEAGLGVAATILLAPWGFMLAYGLSLFIIGVVFDCTFPVRTEASAQQNAAGLR